MDYPNRKRAIVFRTILALVAMHRVLIPDGESTFTTGVVRSLAMTGRYEVHVLSADPRAPIRYSRHIRNFVVRENDTPLRDAIAGLVGPAGIDLLLPVDEPAIECASVNARTLGALVRLPPLPDVTFLRAARSKWHFARTMMEAGLPTPSTVLLSPGETTLHDALPFPVLIKPCFGSYGVGIRRFDDPQALREYVQTHPGLTTDSPFIVQSVMSGTDVDCSCFYWRGELVAHTVQSPLGSDHDSFRPAGAVQLLHDDRVQALAQKALATLRWSGVAHFDMRRDPTADALAIIEVNPRFWGSLAASTYAGVNFPHLMCCAALGEQVPKQTFREIRYFSGSAFVRSLLSPRAICASHQRRTTAFRHILRDPGPEISEFVRRRSRHV